MSDMRTAGVEQPRRGFKLWYIFPIGCLGLLAFIGVLVFFVFNLTQPVVNGADAFMGALKDGRYEQAYQQAAPSLQQELGSAQAFGNGVGAYRPQAWSWSQRSITNNVGNVSGGVTWQNGNSGTAEIQLHQVNGEWRVVAFRFN